MPYRLVAFGGLSLCDAESNRKIAVPRKALALMAVLAVLGRKPYARESLVALLWPDGGDAGRAALKQSIYELRQALRSSGLIVGAAELALDPTEVGSDVAELEAAVEAGNWSRVAELHTGPFLEGFHVKGSPEFEHWVDTHRARYDAHFREAVESLAGSAAARGDVAASVTLWRRLAAHDPLNGRVAVRLLQALAASGDPAGALTHYQVHTRLLRHQLDVPPDAEVVAAAEAIRAQLSAGAGQRPRVSHPPTDETHVRAGGRARTWMTARVMWTAAATVAVLAAAFASTSLRRSDARVVASLILPPNAAMRVTVDSHLDKVYVDGGASFDAALAVIDGRTFTTRVLPHGAGVAVDPVTHWYWSGDARARAIVVRNGRTDAEIGRIAVSGCPHAFALTGVRVWIAQQCEDHLSVVDSRDRHLIHDAAVRTMSRQEVGGAKGMGEVFVNPNTGIAYFSKDGIPQRMDPNGWQMRETPRFEGPVIAVNEAANRLYVRIDRGLRVIDGASEQLLSDVELPGTPARAAIGFGGRRVYVAITAGLAVLDGDANRLLSVVSLGNGFAADGVAIDVARNRAYVSGNDETGTRMLKVVSLDN